MPYKTKEQQAQEYADAKVKENYGSESNFEWMHIKQAFKDGHTACEQSMWRSVEDELPEEETMVIAHHPNGRIDVLKYHDGEFIDELGQQHCVDFYIVLPSLPDTNTEKK